MNNIIKSIFLKTLKNLPKIAVFISAFLLFSLEPLFGKRILPWYGGVPNVWIALMTLYMGLMSIGYFYTLLINILPISKQLLIHKIIIIGTVIFLILHSVIWNSFILPQSLWQQFSVSQPAFSITLIALLHIGIPFFLLSTTSTILQSWFAVSKNNNKSTYSLYAVSNIGSFVGLIAYPIIIEPLLTVRMQAIIWAGLYFFFAFCMLFIINNNQKAHLKLKSINKNFLYPNVFSIVLWVLLSFLSTLSLLATTSYITQAVAPVAFFWLLPLALYLLSFIVTFSDLGWYDILLYPIIFLFLLIFNVLLYVEILSLPYLISLSIIVLTMWLLMLITHKKLYDIRPHQRNIPVYYFTISIGSLLAALFCSYIAPNAFSIYLEYPLSLLFGAILCIFIFIYLKIPVRQKISYVFTGIIILIIIVFNLFFLKTKQQDIISQKRNFFGITRVVNNVLNPYESVLELYNGKILHGIQVFDKFKYKPTIYYVEETGVGQAITKHPKRLEKNPLPLRVAGIGLGVGTIASYCSQNDYFHFYEINPEVIRISQTYFTFISRCREMGGKVEITQGDGRISLSQELDVNKKSQFDVIVVDAFTDDAIPTHLLTKEAMQIYLSSLEEDGIIAFHITNSIFNLKPVIYQHAQKFNLSSYLYSFYGFEWILLSKNPLEIDTANKLPEQKEIKYWTDDYTSIFQIIKNNTRQQ